MDIGVIILAAGSSSRMGQSKQLLMLNNDESLLLHATKTALQVNDSYVIVVLGSNVDVHKKVIQHLPVKIAFNTNWQQGMGSSIKTGLTELLSLCPTLPAVLIMVCDQPLLTAAHLNRLILYFKENQNSIIASGYSDIVGSPALFKHTEFKKILNMNDSDGARKVIQANNDVVCIPFEEGSVDLDTLEDYQKFLANK